ncbi:hypothetical protein PAXRUDRAFT_830158 [Paxillus rubicundulus Ve08.2h10]|uniref:Uncharacterized protein n=1 Tax=Paxillus rubicundulus Ve08.2h10 TaxID=930991 RepID=A0A0D0D622_9AGAM|nr:hypothetical protein PAXRUDRAFT_830158 [Paxillus rubicundulus Ve08.2h10]
MAVIDSRITTQLEIVMRSRPGLKRVDAYDQPRSLIYRVLAHLNKLTYLEPQV